MGLWTGLSRAGLQAPIASMGSHGILMVLGFLGTLIALERAVALRETWPYAAPLLSAVATGVIVASGPRVLAGTLLTVAGVIVVAAYGSILRQQRHTHHWIMAGGGIAWVVAAALWTAGRSPAALAPALGAFLVLTIVGERLELSRLRIGTSARVTGLLATMVAFGLGVTISLVALRPGMVVAGLGLVAMTTWLVRNDIARITIQSVGIARFSAAAMLTGYLWLALSGVLWVMVGLQVGPALTWDAALHSLFLGFAISMVMGHAPIIMPAVLGTGLTHHPASWAPLGLLHASVALRVGSDLSGMTGLTVWRQVSLYGNVTALVLFVVVAAVAMRRGAPPAMVPGPHTASRQPVARGDRA